MTNIIFSPPPGLRPDETSFAAEGLWHNQGTNGNVRFKGGKPEVIGGWEASGISTVSGTPSKMFEWTNLAGTNILAIGTTTKLYVSVAGLFDVTPTGLGTVTRWSLSDYGQTLMASPTGGTLYQWSNNTGVIAAEVTQAPDVITRMLVTNERQVLAFGCNEVSSGTFNGLCIRGSNLEDPTNWTPTTTNNSFEDVLDGPGKIVTALHLGDGIAVLTTTALWYGQFLGNPEQTYRWERIGDGCGCLGMDSAVAVNGVLYWITPDYQPVIWTPGSPPLPMPCPLLRYFQLGVNTTKATTIQRTFAFYNAKFSEVWFFYPTDTASTEQPRLYVAVSIIDGKWFSGSMNRTAMHQGISFLYGITSNGISYLHERGYKGVSASVLQWNIVSGGFHTPKAARDVMIREAWGDFADQRGNVTVGLVGYRYPISADTLGTSSGAQNLTFTTSTTKKSARLSGRIFTVELSGNDTSGTTDTFMRVGELVFDAVETGKR